MEKQFPKNVRQIGNVCDTPKIYVEDYVDTYLNQIKEQTREQIAGAFLVGERGKIDEQECVYVTGAVRAQLENLSTSDMHINEAILTKARKECGDYFPGQEIVGWMLVESNGVMGLSNNIIQCHEKFFPEKNSLFIQKHPVENEELYFAYKFHELMQMGGHYIFYEKNPAMQNYMINVRRQIGVTPSEMVEDRAAKDFRNTIKGRKEMREQKTSGRFAYMTSAALIVMVLAIGVSAMNNYEKMSLVQDSIATLSESVKRVENESVLQLADKETEVLTKETNEEVNEQEEADKTDSGMEPQVSTIQEELKKNESEYYIVEKGDTLDSISQKIYGTRNKTEDICKMNGLSDGNLIFIGQKLLLP